MKPYVQRKLCAAVLRALQALADRYDSQRLQKTRLWLELLEKFPGTRVSSDALERLTESTKCRLPDRRMMYWEPNHEVPFVPIVTFDWDFEKSEPTLTLRMFLFGFDEHHLGFRFDSAEGEIHSRPFCHIQLAGKWRPGGKSVAGKSPAFWPESYPAFPVAASDPVSLLISALVSIYQPKKVGEILRHLEPFDRNNLKNALRGLSWYQAAQ